MSHRHALAAAFLSLGLIVPVAASAQQAPPAGPVPATAPMRHHHNGFRTALTRLNLSSSQRSQIDSIFAQARGQNKGADKETRKANRVRLRGQIEAILTPEQRTQLRAEMQRQRHGATPR